MATTAKVGAIVLWKSDGRNFDLAPSSSGIHNQLNFGTAQIPGIIISLVATIAFIQLLGVPGTITLAGVAADAGGTTPNTYAVVDLSA
jgi:hypothetical protein